MSTTSKLTQLSAAVALSLGSLNVNAIPLMADVATIVDESGSMSTEHAWLPTMIGDLETGLVGAGVGVSPTNNYAKVGFGGHVSGDLPHKHQEGGSDWFGAGDFDEDFVASGGEEDGWNGINYFFDNYSIRSDAALNVILVTDEDRDNQNTGLTKEAILSSFLQHNALLNAVVDASFVCGDGSTALGIDSAGNGYKATADGGFSVCAGGRATGGYGTTLNDYVDLALTTGGAAWDLNQLRAGGPTAASFTNSFVNIKVGEIQRQPPSSVPEPSTIALMGAGLAGFGFSRKRKAAL